MSNYVHPRLDPNNRFRERRREAIVRRRRRRLAVATILLALGAGLGAGATVIGGGSKHSSSPPAISQAPVNAEKPNTDAQVIHTELNRMKTEDMIETKKDTDDRRKWFLRV